MAGNLGFNLSDYDFDLPESSIAQKPAEIRDNSKLLIFDRKTETITHKYFYEIDQYFNENDLLVLNNSKVIPARLFGEKENGAKIDVVIVEEIANREFTVITKLAKLKVGQKIIFTDKLEAIFLGRKDEYGVLKFNLNKHDFYVEIEGHGKMPLPPYIKREADEKDRDRYQTVYAKNSGSIAAPTAGLHFTKEVLAKIKARETLIEYVTLHVGVGTFKPIKTDQIKEHKMMAEEYEIPEDFFKNKKRITTVGTTSTRTLESFAKTGKLMDKTDLYIYPGHKFFIDRLITNFHVPHSTPLMLVAAFIADGLEGENKVERAVKILKKIYAEAIEKGYRFYSYGDAMLII